MFSGYYRDEEATARVLRDGWLHSGDAGRLDADGHLTVIGRLNDVVPLPDGTSFAAQAIENKLKFSPYIREAIIVGSGKASLAALIAIDGRVVSKWAGDSKLNYTTYSDLAAKPEVYALIQKELDRVNGELPASAKIRAFALLYKELDADDEELTRTGKVRRCVVEKRFAPVINAMYADCDSIEIDTAICLQDGKSARIQTTVAIRSLA